MCPDETNLLTDICTPLTEAQARMYSPLTLAFLGDAVYSLLVRNMLSLAANKPTGKLHKESITYVNAAFQASMIRELLPHLTESEATVFKRGRNAKSFTVPKNADVGEYRRATGFEALLGWLYMKGQTDRLEEIMKAAYEAIHINENK